MDHTKITTSHRKKCCKFYRPEGVLLFYGSKFTYIFFIYPVQDTSLKQISKKNYQKESIHVYVIQKFYQEKQVIELFF